MVTVMTKEAIAERQNTASAPTAVRDEISEIWEQASKDLKTAKERFKNLRPLCPEDETPGKFVRYEGSYTRVHGIFRCENGHEFNYGARLRSPRKK